MERRCGMRQFAKIAGITVLTGAVLASGGVAASGLGTSVVPDGQSASGIQPVTQTFTTVGRNTFTVPGGDTQVTVTAIGGAGGSGIGVSPGGSGAKVTGTLTVTPNEQLQIGVGGAGQNSTGNGSAGGGGGSSTVTAPGSTMPVVIAGGGGGSVGNPIANGNNLPGASAGSPSAGQWHGSEYSPGSAAYAWGTMAWPAGGGSPAGSPGAGGSSHDGLPGGSGNGEGGAASDPAQPGGAGGGATYASPGGGAGFGGGGGGNAAPGESYKSTGAAGGSLGPVGATFQSSGNGPADGSGSVTISYLPGPATNVSVQVDGSSAYVKWTEPNPTGPNQPTLTYRLVAGVNGGPLQPTVYGNQLANLRRGDSYQVAVQTMEGAQVVATSQVVQFLVPIDA